MKKNTKIWICTMIVLFTLVVLIPKYIGTELGIIGLITIIIINVLTACVVISDFNELIMMENPLNKYEPTYLLEKEFMCGCKKYKIIEYMAFSESEEDRKFICLNYTTGEVSPWYEHEMKMGIAKGDIKMVI